MSHTRDKTPSDPVPWQKAKSNCACERYQMCLWFINLSGDCLWYLKSNSCFIHQLLPTSTRVFSWEPQQCRLSICLFNHVWAFITHDMFNLDSESRVIIIMMKPGQCWVLGYKCRSWGLSQALARWLGLVLTFQLGFCRTVEPALSSKQGFGSVENHNWGSA